MTNAHSSLPSIYRIGDWRFDPAACSLTGHETTRRLEDRAARTLTLLCERRGETVTQEEILAAVWNSRAISPNSVAVVMRDLRRALDDDARNARHIVTVPKRGYRLATEERLAPVVLMGSPWRSDWAVLAIAAVITIGAVAARPADPKPTVLAVESVRNETGNDAYDTLALALGELVTKDMTDASHVRIITGDSRSGSAPDMRLTSTLILWNDIPTLSMSAVDPATGAVVWADMAAGPADALAGNTLADLDVFKTQLATATADRPS